jgi:hypothetical protein
MLRSSITCAGVLLLGASAFAQSSTHSSLRPITGPVRDAGIYHLGTGTWTHNVHTSNLGPDIIYANTCNTGYYGAQINGETWSDEGRVPSTSGPVLAPNQNKGCHDSYTVNGFQIAYCTTIAPGTFACTIGFQSAYLACTLAAPTNTYVLTGLPAGTGTSQNCWLVTVDLAALSQTFVLTADATGTFPTGDAATNHLFGWQFTTNVVSPANSTGPIIAGQSGSAAAGCSGVDGTRWDTLTGAPAPTWPANQTSGNPNQPTGPEDGLGMDTQDRFRIDNGRVAAGCYFFGGSGGSGVPGNPIGSFHLRLFSAAGCPPPQLGADECIPGVAGVMACPCSNPQVPAGSTRGCNNSAATGGAQMTSTGAASLTTDTASFTSSGEKPTASTIFLQGKDPILAAGVKFGQGVRCINATLKRLYVHNAVAGTVTFPQGGDANVHTQSAAKGDVITAGTNRHYMCYYRDPTVLGACTPLVDTFNASQSQVVLWTP